MAGQLKILVVEPDEARARMIIDGLAETGDPEITVLGSPTGLARRMAQIEPDVVLIAMADPSRDTLEALSIASGFNDRPVAMFVDRSDDSTTRAAIEAGVSAYVVDGLAKDRIQPVLDAAIARFNMFKKLRNELAAAKSALAERKTIERAKGLLMTAKGISEDEAYAMLRKTAMDQGRKVSEVAEALVTASDLLR
ncbi:ANTAR domain-containing response regulator [Tropicimonas sp. S265A]|uniref:ANTAR domain-containing response regulator n=1 Tax=Tropicimonas sp. S265A TaxID=3415134 RepID=UPI003C7B6896